MQIITTAIIKGGSGKTTSALCIAQAAKSTGARVLGIDLDAQGNFSYAIGADISKPGALDMLHGRPAASVIQSTPQGIDAITAAPELATEQTTAGSIGRLRSFLLAIDTAYDLAVIDTPPAIGETTYNALAAATDLIIPMRAAPYDIAGLFHLITLWEAIHKGSPQVKRKGIIISQYDGRAKIAQHMIGEIETAAARCHIPIIGYIRQGVAIQEAQAMRKSLYETAPKSKPAADYKAIYERIRSGNGKTHY